MFVVCVQLSRLASASGSGEITVDERTSLAFHSLLFACGGERVGASE